MSLMIILSKSIYCFLFIWATGHVLLSFYKSDSSNVFLNNLLKLFIGTISIVVVYSLIIAKLITVNLSITSVIIYFLIVKRSHLKFDKQKLLNIDFSSLLLCLFIFLAYSVFWSLQISSIEGGLYNFPWLDTAFYSKISLGLGTTGLENTNSVLFQHVNLEGIQLYHYFDLWLNSFLSAISFNSSYVTLYTITYPLIISMIYLGLISLFSSKKLNIFIIILVFLLPFALSIPLENFSSLFSSFGLKVNIGNVYGHKTLINYLLVLLSAIYIMKGKYFESVIFLTICLTIYSTTIVGLVPACIVLISYQFYRNKGKFIHGLIVLLITSFTLFVLFYFNSDPNAIPGDLIIHRSGKQILIIFIEYVLTYVIPFSPVYLFFIYLMILDFRSKKEFRFSLILFLVILITCLIATCLFSALFHGNADIAQSIANIIPCFYLAIMALIISEFYTDYKTKTPIIIGSFLIISGITLVNNYKINHSPKLISPYSTLYMDSSIEYFRNYPGPKFTLIDKDGVTLEDSPGYSYFKAGIFLYLLDNVSLPLDLTPEINKNNLSVELNREWILNFCNNNAITHLVVHQSKEFFMEEQTSFILINKDVSTGESIYEKL